MSRHPHHSKRPSFEEALQLLLDNEQTVLLIPSEDAATHDDAACLGAELQAGHRMYTDLQALYIPSNASISERPWCTSAHLVKYTSDKKESDYESLDSEETPPYLSNTDHSSLPGPAGESSELYYRNIGTRQDGVNEAIYDRVSKMTGESDDETNSEEYYNVVTATMSEENDHVAPHMLTSLHSPAVEASRTEPSPPPLGPKPSSSSSDHTYTIPLHELVDGDYYEVGVSIFTSNNDEVVV